MCPVGLFGLLGVEGRLQDRLEPKCAEDRDGAARKLAVVVRLDVGNPDRVLARATDKLGLGGLAMGAVEQLDGGPGAVPEGRRTSRPA